MNYRTAKQYTGLFLWNFFPGSAGYHWPLATACPTDTRPPFSSETTGGSTRCHAATVLEHLVGGAGDPAGPATGPALPPFCSLTEKDEPNPTHHHTACCRGEGDTFCDATANNSRCCGSRLESAGSPAHNGTPALSPEEEPWRAGGGTTHAPRTTNGADRHRPDAHIPQGASLGSALLTRLCCP